MIRKAIIEDIDNGLLEIYIEGYRHHQKGRPDIFADITEEELKKELINKFETIPIIVSVIDNEIIGYLIYKIKEKRIKLIDIEQLVIKECCRGRGEGKKLIEAAKEIAIQNDFDKIVLNCWMFNENALAMYEHVGFEKQRIMYEMNLR